MFSILPNNDNSAADNLAAALEEYQRDYRNRIKQPPNKEATEARALVDEANKIIGQAGLGPALAPTLLEHVRYWPSWIERSDFAEHIHIPVTDVRAAKNQTQDQQQIVLVRFVYQEVDYGVFFIDAGLKTGFDGPGYHLGKVEFLADRTTVLGLDVSLEGGPFARWKWINVFAFQIGTWMQHLLELATIIDERNESFVTTHLDNDALERAKRIKL